MDEDIYRDTYRNVITTKCVFEKAINSRQVQCGQANKVRLADREAVSCRSKDSCTTCTQLLEILRNKAVFSLKLLDHTGPLPHAKEIKVQMGCVIGLAINKYGEALNNYKSEKIDQLIQAGLIKYNTLESFPYEELMRSIVNFEGRSKRNSRKKE